MKNEDINSCVYALIQFKIGFGAFKLSFGDKLSMLAHACPHKNL